MSPLRGWQTIGWGTVSSSSVSCSATVFIEMPAWKKKGLVLIFCCHIVKQHSLQKKPTDVGLWATLFGLIVELDKLLAGTALTKDSSNSVATAIPAPKHPLVLFPLAADACWGDASCSWWNSDPVGAAVFSGKNLGFTEEDLALIAVHSPESIAVWIRRMAVYKIGSWVKLW